MGGLCSICPILVEEARQAVFKMKHGRVPEGDSMPVEILEASGEGLKGNQVVTSVYNTGKNPSDMQ